MSVELYYNPWCKACGGGDGAKAGHSAVRWIDTTQHLEIAASLRITRLPALVVDGKLVAQGPRALERLRSWMIKEVNAR